MILRLHVAYDGSDFCGWQIQPDARTVEGELTQASAQILDRPAARVELQGASRTDSGTHAAGQVAHLVCDRDRSCWDFARGLNALTPDAICVNRVERAPDDFHARFDAGGKLYRYDIWNHRFQHPLRHRYSWQFEPELDLARMREAAAMLEGTHDFEAFRAASCQSPTTERNIHRVDVDSRGRSVSIRVAGNAFLRYMVRVMAGTLAEIGAGEIEPKRIPELFETGRRDRAGITAPAEGLTLVEVRYPDDPWRGPEPEIGAYWLADAPR